MRKNFQGIYRTVLVVILAMSVVSCSSVIDRVKNLGKPKTEPKKTEPKKTEPKKTEPKKTEPEKPDVQSTIKQGIAHRKAGKFKKAIASFEQALEIEPENAEAAQYLQETQNELDELVMSHLNKGIKYFEQDALEDAIREWDKVLELDPSNEKAAEYKKRAQKRLDALK